MNKQTPYWSILFRLGLLLLILSWERVVGLPVLTIGLLIVWLELSQDWERLVTTGVIGFFLAVIYQLPFTLSLLLLAAGWMIFYLSRPVIRSKWWRTYAATGLVCLVLAVWLQPTIVTRTGFFFFSNSLILWVVLYWRRVQLPFMFRTQVSKRWQGE